MGPETMADARHPEIKAGPIDAVNLHRAVTRTPMSRRAFTTECAFPSTETATAVLAPQPDRDLPRDETAEELEDQARTTVIVPDLDPSIPAVLRAHVPPEENAQACPCLCHHAMTSTLGDPPMPSSPLVEILTPPIRTRALAEALTTIPTVTVPNIAIVILTDVAAPALLGVLGVAAPARIRIPSAVVQWIDMTEVGSSVAHLLTLHPRRNDVNPMMDTHFHPTHRPPLTVKRRTMIWCVIEKKKQKPSPTPLCINIKLLNVQIEQFHDYTVSEKCRCVPLCPNNTNNQGASSSLLNHDQKQAFSRQFYVRNCCVSN